jgi:integrase
LRDRQRLDDLLGNLRALMAARRSYRTGSIKREGPRSYRIRWRMNGRQISETHTSLDLARRALASRVADVASKRARIATAGSISTMKALAKEWFKRRCAAGQHRSVDDEASRWTNHLEPTLGPLTPDEVTPAVLRRLFEQKLTRGRLRERGKLEDRKQASEKGLSSSTVRLLRALVSTMFSDLIDDGHAITNPARNLPKKARKLFRPAHDPRTTPFVERAGDVRRVFLALAEPFNVAYALGVLAGLRTGEVRALAWAHVDLERRRIHVRASAEGPLKDDESRIVPVQAGLLPVLKAWHLSTGGAGLVVPPVRKRSRSSMLDEQSMGRALREALTALGLPRLTWYQATRHTFASQWVLAGGDIAKLKELLGHSTVLVTERYAHLRPDLFEDRDRDRIPVDLSPGTAKVTRMPESETHLRRNGAERRPS